MMTEALPSKTYVVGERKIRYLRAGRGPSVAFIHETSPGSSADVWRGTLEPIAEHGLRTLAVDLPGYGDTDVGDDVSDEGIKRFLWAWLDVFGILDKVGLVGRGHTG